MVNIPAEIANLAKSVASYVKQNSSSIKQYLQMSQELYNTYQSSKALIQQVKMQNFLTMLKISALIKY